MAKRARVKGKGADIFFSEPAEDAQGQEDQTDGTDEVTAENERLKTEIQVLQKRVELLEKEVQPLRSENAEMRKRLETYADAFAKMLVESVTSGSSLESILAQLGLK